MPTMLQSLEPSGTPNSVPTQQPGGLSTLNFLEFQSRSLLILLVVAQVITLLEVHQLL